MRAKHFCVLTTTEFRVKIWHQLYAFKTPPPPPPPVAQAAIRSKAVVLLFLYCIYHTGKCIRRLVVFTHIAGIS